MGWGAAWGWGCLVGLGKCNSSLQPGVAAEREARGRKPPGSAVKVWGWGSHRADPGVWGSEAGSARRGLGEGADGGSPVWSPGRRPPARSLARSLLHDSLQSPQNLSALRVWQRCLEKGSAEAALLLLPLRVPHPPLPRPPPLRPPPAPPTTPLLGWGARLLARPSKLGTASQSLWEETWGIWDWRQHPIHGPGAQELPGCLDPRGLAGFGASFSGTPREPAAVPGAGIAAWPEAETALGSCPQLGTGGGRRPRD